MAPIKTPNRIYKDLDLSFSAHPEKGDVLKKLDISAITQSLRSLLFTIPGERPFQPNLGSPLYNLLFEQLDDISIALIDKTIAHTIQNFEPRVSLDLVQIFPNDEENEVQISIFFTVKGTQTPASFTTTLKRLR
jgi:phage baseplate assembly protein W